MTTLIACSHGTRFEAGRVVVTALVDAVRAAVPGVAVVPSFVDVEYPQIDEVVAEVAARGPAVVVPLLLSTGFHTNVDIRRAVAAHPQVAQTAPLGPHRLLAEVLAERIAEAAGPLQAGDRVVLAAAGSSAPSAAVDVEGMAALLATHLGVPVAAAYAAGADPRIAAAIAVARAEGAERVIAASYVLAPGHFADVVAAAEADVTTAPLGADPRVARIVAERFADAVQRNPG